MATTFGTTAARTRPHRTPALLRAPLEGRTWRAYLYVFTSLPLAVFSFSVAVAMTSAGAGLLITFLGVPVLAAALAFCRGMGALERARAAGLLDTRVPPPEPVQALQRGKGLMAWVGALLRSGVSWRHLLHSLLHFPVATFTFCVSVSFWATGWAALLYPTYHWVFPRYTGQPGVQFFGDGHGNNWYVDTPLDLALVSLIGLFFVLVTPWVVRGLTQLDRVMAAGLLGPSRLAARVWELESDRGAVAETATADLRRIERDLHDGAQARLAALAMDLGLAKEKLLEDPEAAARMVDDAHGEVKVALQELRDLARGIHPAILTDRGLGPALSALAARCAVPVEVAVDLDRRPASAIEGITYFTVSELLQNVSKHSHASRATVDIWRTEDRLMLTVGDNGRGGAGTTGGSGLTGLAERLGAVDGLLLVDSPAGGPTSVTAELPWRA